MKRSGRAGAAARSSRSNNEGRNGTETRAPPRPWRNTRRRLRSIFMASLAPDHALSEGGFERDALEHFAQAAAVLRKRRERVERTSVTGGGFTRAGEAEVLARETRVGRGACRERFAELVRRGHADRLTVDHHLDFGRHGHHGQELPVVREHALF